jgi:glycosyltransferase involved in cell wall biosynthesis
VADASRSRAVLFVVPNIVSFATFLAPLGEHLRAAGFDVHCACDAGGLWADSRADGVTIHHVPMPRGMHPGRHLAAAAALRRIVAAVQPAFIHAHFSAAIFTTALARRARWPKTFATFHGMSFPLVAGVKALMLRTAEAGAALRFDHVWVLSDDDAAALRAVSSWIDVTRHPGFGVGCDTDVFDSRLVSATQRSDDRRSLGIEADDVVFTFVGRFTAFKGYADVVRAFLHLRHGAGGRVKLLLVGSTDPLHASGLTDRETRLAAACPDLIGVGWQIDVRKYLASSDVFVFPSQREGMPVCVMEALSMGLPVITSDSRGCRDVVRDGVNATVVRSRSVESLAAAMERLAADPIYRDLLSRGALEAREGFSRRLFVARQMQEYARHAAGDEAVDTVGEGLDAPSLS